MKKIFLSLAIIFAAGAIVIGATSSYFSDTEESTGNTFTAGDLDLVLGGVEKPIIQGDIKPGDKGEIPFSISAGTNDTCIFASIKLASDDDNSCTEPEGVAEGVPCSSEGELNDKMEFTVYDGITPVTTGTLTGDESYKIGKLAGGATKNYTIAWTLPAGVGNEVQTDSFSADVVVNAEQMRNQYDNDCNLLREIN